MHSTIEIKTEYEEVKTGVAEKEVKRIKTEQSMFIMVPCLLPCLPHYKIIKLWTTKFTSLYLAELIKRPTLKVTELC